MMGDVTSQAGDIDIEPGGRCSLPRHISQLRRKVPKTLGSTSLMPALRARQPWGEPCAILR
jgi:hypothetical protein